MDFIVPFPDIARFLDMDGGKNTEFSTTQDTNVYYDYLCSISQDAEKVTNFFNTFLEEYGELPSFDIFETCDKTSATHKRRRRSLRESCESIKHNPQDIAYSWKNKVIKDEI
ncbi:unnamed protein product [Didymodactylos carnosus]|uniref:Uncharacterized protein n=1 Tax=Didymodactylos carnosus TaxID=1234261 RepID=A0A813W4L0_9BILA|nr:unnamed protein product [Didymodactylos carnosus]CAF3637495.1 unnamed protein product [Didymodactylos carnosus]